MRLRLLAALAALLLTAGCEGFVDGTPPTPTPTANVPPAVAPGGGGGDPMPDQIAAFWVRSYLADGREYAQPIRITVTGIEEDGDVANFVDPATGETLPGPDYLPAVSTPFRYDNTVTPGIVSTSFLVEALGSPPPGATLTCWVEVNGQEVLGSRTQTAAAEVTGNFSVICWHNTL